MEKFLKKENIFFISIGITSYYLYSKIFNIEKNNVNEEFIKEITHKINKMNEKTDIINNLLDELKTTFKQNNLELSNYKNHFELENQNKLEEIKKEFIKISNDIENN